MKKINRFIFGLISACVVALGACTDDVPSDDFGQSPAVTGEGVYFPKTIKTSCILTSEDIEADEASGTFTIPVQRTTDGAAVTTELKVKMDDAVAAVLSFPTSVTFEEGKIDATISVTYTNAVRGTKYPFTLSFTDGTEYANSTQTFVAEYPFPEIWEKVTDDAVFIDQMFSMFGVSDYVKEEVVVEKLKDKLKYRFAPYDNEYMDDLFGKPEFFSADEKYYIVLDGERYKPELEEGEELTVEKAYWFIPTTRLGFKMTNGVGISHDLEWLTFGSMAYNTSDKVEESPLGSYNKKKEMFEFGTCFHNINTYGLVSVDGFQLWLNKSKMEVVYDRDYAPWTLVEGATGIFESELLKDKFVVDLEEGTSGEGEDPIFHIKSLYAKDVNIVFFHNKTTNAVRVPKKQKTGLTSYGNDIYMDAKKASYDEKNKIYTFEIKFYLVDKETGKKSAVLATTVEKFKVGSVPKIDDYAGDWTFTQKEKNSAGEINEVRYDITISKVDDENLVVKGLTGISGYDDAVSLSFIKSNGTLQWNSPETMPDYGPYQVEGMFVGTEYYLPDHVMIGGFDDNGNIAFTDAKDNQYPVVSYNFIAMQDGQPIAYLQEITNFVWKRSESATITPAATFRTYQKDLRMKANSITKDGFISTIQVKPVQSVKVPLRLVEE